MDDRIRRSLEALKRGGYRPVRIQHLAAQVGLGASRFAHLFKSETGTSLRNFLLEQRLERARELIAATDQRISEVFLNAGFRDASNFDHLFKRRYGLSPREYRREARGESWSRQVIAARTNSFALSAQSAGAILRATRVTICERETNMSDALLLSSDQLNDHNLEKLVDKTVALMKVSIVQGLSGAKNPTVYKFRNAPLKLRGGRTQPTVAQVVAERVDKLDPVKANVLRVNLGRDQNTTNLIRTLGVDVRSAKRAVEQVNLAQHFSFVNGTNFSADNVNRMVTGLNRVVFDVPAAPAATAGAVLNRGVKFRIREVRCVDETNPEWAGSDEIAFGGTAINDKGVASPLPEKYVGGGFDDGDRKVYNPPLVVANFPLDDAYPKNFGIALALAEKDAGGLSRFIQELYTAIKGELEGILDSLGAAAGAYIGSAIGAGVGTSIAGPLGTILGAIAGAAVGALVGWLSRLIADDIFTPQATELILANSRSTFPGGRLVSPPMSFDFRDHGGYYKVAYDWEIAR